jgi:hypothetical protein
VTSSYDRAKNVENSVRKSLRAGRTGYHYIGFEP